MRISVTDLDDDLIHVALAGRMDALGVEKVAIPFTAATATRRALIAVDLAEVDFLASAALRQFFANARTQQQRGGQLVLAAPQPDVRAVLDASGVQQAIAVFDTLNEALAALRQRTAGAS
jgi:anti-anti-sigma factor